MPHPSEFLIHLAQHKDIIAGSVAHHDPDRTAGALEAINDCCQCMGGCECRLKNHEDTLTKAEEQHPRDSNHLRLLGYHDMAKWIKKHCQGN